MQKQKHGYQRLEFVVIVLAGKREEIYLSVKGVKYINFVARNAMLPIGLSIKFSVFEDIDLASLHMNIGLGT